jgi:putative membrane protein
MSARLISAAVVILTMPALSVSLAAPASADLTFVASVSQGGRYEVEASKLAEKRATAADVKDIASTEVHDHEMVNAKLKQLAQAAGIPIASELNSMFKERLATLAASGSGFDAAYIEDMKQIHDKDEKLFAKEAMEGSSDLKTFAHETDLIVKRHIGALHGTD